MVKPNIPEDVYNMRTLRDAPEKCWLWSGGHNTQGYPTVWIKGKSRKVSHIALEMHGIPRYGIGRDCCALHSCDNPRCVNPHHLRWGTYADNVADKLSRGRGSNGDPTKRETYKRTPEVVKAVLESDEGCKVLARKLGVSTPVILRIRRDNGVVSNKVGPEPTAQKRVLELLQSVAVENITNISINDVARRLDMKPPNVARALRILSRKSLIAPLPRTGNAIQRYEIA